MCWSSSSTTTDTSTSVWMAAPVWSRDRLVLIWGVTISPLNGKIDQSEQDRQFYKRFLFLFAPTCFFASKEKKYTPEMTHLALGQPAAALSSVCMKMIYWLVLEETLGLFLFSEIHYWFLWGEGTLRENTDLNQSDNIAFIDLFGKRSTRARSEMNQLCRKQNYYHFVVYCWISEG